MEQDHSRTFVLLSSGNFIGLSVLIEADEAFITNSMIGIMPLTIVDGKPINTGKEGALTLKLRRAYGKLVKEETA